MKALCWEAKHKVQVNDVPDPTIEDSRDAIIKITSTAICGSDLHLYDGVIPSMKEGDVLGHEFMGEVVELGKDAGGGKNQLKVGDRVVVPFTISCGHCLFCAQTLYGLCDTSNPNGEATEKLYGARAGAIYGYSHMYGGFAGGQAQYARVPFADVGPIQIPDHLSDEQVLFLTDVFSTGFMAVDNCKIKPGDSVAIWGGGAVGQFAARSAFLLGAEHVFVIDNIAERLEMAEKGGAEPINFQDTGEETNLFDLLKQKTGGHGPNHCVDAVGMEAHGTSPGEIYDYIKQGLRLSQDRPNVLRQCIQACRKGGTVSTPGVYGGFLDKIPYGAAFAKGLTFKMGQTHVQAYLQPLLKMIEDGKIDPSFIITHELPLESAVKGYETFRNKQDGCIKVVLKPFESTAAGKVQSFSKENEPQNPHLGDDTKRA